jgi:hypothetical protein
MFQMRPGHVAAFEAEQLRSFEERAVRHARRTLPNDTEGSSDEQLKSRFRREMPKAQSYGLESERQILCFFDAGLMLGEGFDREPRLPWVQEILMDRQSHPEDRAQRLVRAAATTAGYEVLR